MTKLKGQTSLLETNEFNDTQQNINENNLGSLPLGWQWVKLGDVCEVVAGGTPSTKDLNNFCEEGGHCWLTPADLSGYINKFISRGSRNITTQGLKSSSAKLMPKGTVLFTSRAPIGYVAIASNEISTNQGFKSFIPNDQLESEYIYFYLKSEIARKLIDGLASGTTFKEISGSNIKKVEIPLPPTLDEQKKIVDKIEELFSDLDKGIEALKKAKEQIKTYKQSVLKWAFEGKLSEPRFTRLRDYQDSETEKSRKSFNQENQGSDIPPSWQWVTFSDVCTKIGDVDHKMPKTVDEGYPYLSTKDFTDDYKISFEKAKYISKEDFLNLSRKIKPEKGDIIFPRYGTIGKNVLVDCTIDFLVSYSCAVIKPNREKIISEYLYWYSLSPKISEEIRKYTVETTQANVGIASIKRFVFPLPPTLDEQKQIVEEIERRFTVTEKVEEAIEENLKRADMLRQSILKQAFEGKLV